MLDVKTGLRIDKRTIKPAPTWKNYTCQLCSKSFEDWDCKKRIYCSDECLRRANRKRVELECPSCKRLFTVKHYRLLGKQFTLTCSRACAAKAKATYRFCGIPGCNKEHSARGFCDLHYNRSIKELNDDGDLRRRFGILTRSKGGPPGLAGLEEYNRRITAQNGVCAMCGNPPIGKRLNLDHSHSTGRLRGLLCKTCNHRILGILEKCSDNVSLEKISRYLKLFDPENPLLRQES